MRLRDIYNKVLAGESVECRLSGNSMDPVIKHRELVRISPLTREPEIGDTVLCKVNGRLMTHRLNAVRGNQCQITNQKRFVNGWCHRSAIYGLVELVEKRHESNMERTPSSS